MVPTLAASSRSGHAPAGVFIGLGVLLLLLGVGLLVAMSMPRVVEYDLTHDRNYHKTPRLTGGQAHVRIWATRMSGVVTIAGAILCFIAAAKP